MTADPALRLKGISKAYAGPVLANVGLDVRAGEVHALVGANGAGKTTLARIISGLARADTGTMHLDGRSYAPSNKAEAEDAGVHIVQQELNLIRTLTVAENLFLNRLPRKFGFVARETLHTRAREALEYVGMGHVNPRRLVGDLGVGQQQLVEIASAISRRLRILILDEPTAALTGPEIELLFSRIRELRAAGVGFIYISHRMEEIAQIADRVSTLRDGRLVGTCAGMEASIDKLVTLMTGPGQETSAAEAGERLVGEPVLRVRGLRRGPLVRDISLELRSGEIVGISGLVGSGRTETLRALFGADRPECGVVETGVPLRPVRIRSPRDAVLAGIGMLPEDRKADGLLLSQAITPNITLARTRAVTKRAWLRKRTEERIAEEYRTGLDIRCDSVRQHATALSGGNQQKVLLARWLMRDCGILLCDEPTRGIDAPSRSAIYARLRELANAGKAILVASSDMEELLLLCDRILVLSAGRIAGEFDRSEFDKEAILTAAFSGYSGRRHQAEAQDA